MLNIARRLTMLKKAWQGLDVTPRSLDALGMPDKDSRYIEETIDHLVDMASRLASLSVAQTSMVQRSCEEHLNHLEAFFADGNTEIPNMRLLGFIILLLQMQSTLRDALSRTNGVPGTSPDTAPDATIKPQFGR